MVLRWVTPVCGDGLLSVFYCIYLPEECGVGVYLAVSLGECLAGAYSVDLYTWG